MDRERVCRPAVIHTTQTIAFLTVDLRQGSGSHANRRGRNSHERPRPYPGSMSEPDTSASPIHPLPHRVSELFDPSRWRGVEGFAHVASPHAEGPTGPAPLTDVTYHRGCVRDADGAWLRDLPVVIGGSRQTTAGLLAQIDSQHPDAGYLARAQAGTREAEQVLASIDPAHFPHLQATGDVG